MKNYLLCIPCVFIFNLCWFFLVLAEDAVTIPSVTAPENVSSDDIEDGEKKSTQNEGGEDLIHNLEPSVDVSSSFNEKIEENGETFSKQLFAEATSQNSGVANEITTSGQQVVVTLTDSATAELQQRAAIIPSQEEKADKGPAITNRTENTKSGPAGDLKPELNQSRSEAPNASLQRTDEMANVPLKTKDNLTEEIPSFSEWAQKQLEEAEKNKEPSNGSAHPQHSNGKQGSGAKLRWKNYASLDCGAKVVASNPEAVSPSAILSPSRDEYKLNTCTSRIWFIVELCEAIQAKKIDLANFELFSSSPKDFVVSVSDRFPTREWSNVGQFAAKDERDVQSFDLHPHLFGKYIKVEVKSHYGSEHYCPISLFRVYGTSEFEVLQKEDPVHADRLEDDDDDDESLDAENGDASKNLFSSATDAVISMVKKAAQVLGNKGNHSQQTEASNATIVEPTPLTRACTSPSHLVVCNNCTDVLFGEVYELLSCGRIGDLVAAPAIRRDLVESDLCEKFGFDFAKKTKKSSRSSFVRAFFPERFLGAMCNEVAVINNKVVLNVSSSGYSNVTDVVVDEDRIVNIETSEPHVLPTEVEVTDALVLDAMTSDSAVTKSTCSTDISYVSQIKPTKTLITSDLHLKVSDTESVSVESSKVATAPPSTTTTTTSESVHTNASLESAEPEQQLPDVENITEGVETLDDPLEHLISELNGDSHHLPNAQTTASTTTPQAQKESVFLRLSNRIKALERNMSLSGQYLEELSKRYKKQVEEIQKLLDKTIASINEESKRKDEYNRQLEDRLAALTAAVEALVAERKSWSSTVYCVVVSSLVTLFIVSFCCKAPEPRAAVAAAATTKPAVGLRRRKSIDVLTHSAPQKKRRRPSDQALKIVRSSTETHDCRKRKKKKPTVAAAAMTTVPKRSNSIGTLSEEGEHHVWGRQESAPASVPLDWVAVKHVEEIPFALEESEHSSLEPLEGLPKITAPGFLKTASNARASRINGDVCAKKSPTSVNGGLSLVDGEETPRKERRGLKKIFKKVF